MMVTLVLQQCINELVGANSTVVFNNLEALITSLQPYGSAASDSVSVTNRNANGSEAST